MTDKDVSDRLKAAFVPGEMSEAACQRVLAEVLEVREPSMPKAAPRRTWRLAALGGTIAMLAIVGFVALSGRAIPPKAVSSGTGPALRYTTKPDTEWLDTSHGGYAVGDVAPGVNYSRSLLGSPSPEPAVAFPGPQQAAPSLGFTPSLPADTLGEKLLNVKVWGVEQGQAIGERVAILAYPGFDIVVSPTAVQLEGSSVPTSGQLAKMVDPAGFDPRYMTMLTIGASPAVAWTAVDIQQPGPDASGKVRPGVTNRSSGVVFARDGKVFRVRSMTRSTADLLRVAKSLP